MGLALVTAGCGGSTESATQDAFDVYVPSGTPVVREIGAAGPRTPVELSESVVLVLGDGGGKSGLLRIAANDEGRLLVIDLLDGYLRAFDSTGAPEVWDDTGSEILDLESPPVGIGWLDRRLLLTNGYPGRLRVVAPSGEIISDAELSTSPWDPVGLGDGTFVALELETGVVGRYDADFKEIARYTLLEFPQEDLRGEARLWPHQGFVVGRQRVYVTTAENYQVAAFGVGGENLWVLEGEAERVPIPEHVSGRTLGRSRRAGRAAGATIDAEYANAKWPEFYPALASIGTDAQDRLFVFPFVVEENPTRYPVDVYDSAGQPIIRGWLPFQGWDATGQDAVYRIEMRDGLFVVVRYEIKIPEGGISNSNAAAAQ